MASDTSFFGLNRPEYIPSRELFLSELAWSLTAQGSPRRIDKDFGRAGIAFNDRGTRKNPAIETTRPKEGDDRFNAFAKKIKDNLRLHSEAEARVVANVLLHELEAPSSAKATRSVVTPLTLEAALLQDRRGATGKSNPANIALILEQMFALGGGNSSVAALWAKAVLKASPAGLPRWASEAIAELVPEPFQDSVDDLVNRIETHEPSGVRSPAWLSRMPATPYLWFSSAWTNLCSYDWIDSMPRRRWTDWAACVARTGIATGYMFELHLARRMLSALASSVDARQSVREAMEDAKRLFTWDDRLDRSAADVGPIVNRLAAAGTECLSLLADLVEPGDWEGIEAPAEYDDDPDGLSNWLEESRARLSARGVDIAPMVSQALGAPKAGGANNTWETIRYSLVDRSPSGAGDLYAMLRSAGRYTWVEPGQEWLVTIASLCSAGPKTLCRLNDVQDALSSIGVEASQQTLVSRLEGFGLARSSHDADDALEIVAGF